MPSYLDLGLIAVVLVSAFLSMLRGLTREVLAIASWAAAAAAAYYFYPFVLPYVRPYIPKEMIAMVVSVSAVFFVTLIVVSLVTIKLSDAILDSKIGALDRSLGFLFGAGRGYLALHHRFRVLRLARAGKILSAMGREFEDQGVADADR